MKKIVIGCLLGAALAVGTVLLMGAAVLSSAFNKGDPATGQANQAVTAIPGPLLALYASAARTCSGLDWTILAAVGTVESANGTSDLPGVHSGHNQAGAEGPMQFLPATFARYDHPVPPGGAAPPSPYDETDAVYAAARLLCTDGAGTAAGLGRAIFDYNHSTAYVDEVLSTASTLGWGGAPGLGSALVAVEYALAQVGTPYRWGGNTPGVGFDCSGLVQAAWAAAGVALPRVAQQQFTVGSRVVAGHELLPGDLVFFGPRVGEVTHVGMVIDPSGIMVDAPHTGASVRIETFPVLVGSSWGSDIYLGATKPA